MPTAYFTDANGNPVDPVRIHAEAMKAREKAGLPHPSQRPRLPYNEPERSNLPAVRPKWGVEAYREPTAYQAPEPAPSPIVDQIVNAGRPAPAQDYLEPKVIEKNAGEHLNTSPPSVTQKESITRHPDGSVTHMREVKFEGYGKWRNFGQLFNDPK